MLVGGNVEERGSKYFCTDATERDRECRGEGSNTVDAHLTVRAVGGDREDDRVRRIDVVELGGTDLPVTLEPGVELDVSMIGRDGDMASWRRRMSRGGFGIREKLMVANSWSLRAVGYEKWRARRRVAWPSV